MQDDIRVILDRQAAWQRSRAAKSWNEKLRISVAMRGAFISLRRPSPLCGGEGQSARARNPKPKADSS